MTTFWVTMSEEEAGLQNPPPVELDWLDEFASELGMPEKTGPAVTENLASLVTKMLKTKIPEERSKTLLEKFVRPENIPLLVNPRVNQHIWMKLKQNTRKGDLRLTHIGDKVVKTLVALTTIVERLNALKDQVKGDAKTEIKSITKAGLEAVQVSALALHEVSQRRRSEMKFDLHASYRGLCNPPAEEAEELFGANLNDRVRELNDIRRMGRQVTGEGRFERKRPFLGGRRGSYNSFSRGKGRYGQYNNPSTKSRFPSYKKEGQSKKSHFHKK